MPPACGVLAFVLHWELTCLGLTGEDFGLEPVGGVAVPVAAPPPHVAPVAVAPPPGTLLSRSVQTFRSKFNDHCLSLWPLTRTVPAHPSPVVATRSVPPPHPAGIDLY